MSTDTNRQSLEKEKPDPFLTKHNAWVSEIKAKLQEKRQEKEQQEISEVKEKPTINEKTLKLVQKIRNRSNNRIEDYFETLEINRQKNLLQTTDNYLNSIMQSKPQISKKSTEILGSNSFSDNRNIYDDLIRRDEEKKQEKEEKMTLLIKKENSLHKPKINPVSEIIASRLNSTSQQRLFGEVSMKNTVPLEQDYELYSFRPTINPKSREIEEVKGGNSLSKRIEQLYQKERKKKESLEKMRQYYQEKEMEQCTFLPDTKAKTALSPMSSFTERISRWDKRRKEKIMKERAEVEKGEMSCCTFRPVIPKRPLSVAEELTKKSSPIDSTIVTDPLGFDEFVQRIKAARDKLGQKKIIFSTGEKWQNKLTVPKEFNLGKHRKKISSLQKPLSPPVRPPIGRSLYLEAGEDGENVKSDENKSYDQTDEQENDQENEQDNSMGEDGGESETSLIDCENLPPPGLFSVKSSLRFLEQLN